MQLPFSLGRLGCKLVLYMLLVKINENFAISSTIKYGTPFHGVC